MPRLTSRHASLRVVVPDRCLDQEVLAEIVHSHQAEESTVLENRQRMAFALRQAAEDDIQHFRGRRHHKLAVHDRGYSMILPMLGQCDKQIGSSEDTHYARLLHDWEVLLGSLQNQVDGVGQGVGGA